MRWKVCWIVIFLSVVMIASPAPVTAAEGTMSNEKAVAGETPADVPTAAPAPMPPSVAPQAETHANTLETAATANQTEAVPPPSSWWKKVGGWGAAGAIAGSVAPGPGNVIGFFAGIAVGVVHHLMSS